MFSITTQGQFWSQQLQLFLGLHKGKLRYFTPNGELVPSPTEAALSSQQRTDRLAAKLRELNIDLETLIQRRFESTLLSPFILHPSSFILHPYLCPTPTLNQTANGGHNAGSMC